jgi:hypothetical protein
MAHPLPLREESSNRMQWFTSQTPCPAPNSSHAALGIRGCSKGPRGLAKVLMLGNWGPSDKSLRIGKIALRSEQRLSWQACFWKRKDEAKAVGAGLTHLWALCHLLSHHVPRERGRPWGTAGGPASVDLNLSQLYCVGQACDNPYKTTKSPTSLPVLTTTLDTTAGSPIGSMVRNSQP